MTEYKLKAPFPYFGGKSKIAYKVWQALGQPKHYIEPFFGSGAVLLARPGYNPEKHVETINDKDCFVCNVWRALQFSPDEVAKWCDWPVNHADLMARNAALLKNEDRLLENLVADDKWHDPIMAGYWIWATSCWIGSGMLRPNQIPHIGHAGRGINAQRPHIGHAGRGINAQRPHIGDAGKGINGQIPHIGDAGKGINGQIPHIGHARRGINQLSDSLYGWFQKLSNRLRKVRVVCGDWTRVCGGNWQNKIGDCGIFFDPPYGVKDRDAKIYGKHDSTDIAKDVELWCLERGAIDDYRIVVAGYDSEYAELIKAGWTVEAWKANGGYSTSDNMNRHRERLFYSPNCLKAQGILI